MRIMNRFILPTVSIIVGIAMIFPIYMLFIGSFRSETHIFDIQLWPTEFEFPNFKEAVTSSHLLRSIMNSLIVSTTVTAVAMLFHAMSGYALARFQFPGKNVIFAWMLSTLMIPFAVIMLPLYLITKNLGMTNSFAGLIIPAIFNAYGIFLFRQFYREFPKELEEAAYIEGLSQAGTFFRIALPLSMPIIAPLTIGFFLANWNSYIWPLIITQKESMWVIQVQLANLVGGGYVTPWNIVLAAAVIAALPTFLLFFVMQKYLVEGIKMTGIK
ncbi:MULTISPECIES: carbohydrate ABC transporter permease [unclassified Paenibacillus]|uniref:carbohydrate ABC transporter permease n=1 Tax=unclassified Paenibacillus TaxID=185978 RepID=UPI0007089E9E|nr:MULTISPECIES: carbohydrate ABC transporter permease [unclassified Paenibacillus]KQX62654.1 sugar ABC transporter permease [Paenibacillus sp. Root444D2]KRE46364.1 sugar ABC transporter permease [Paenibacillus sp. Soil724D2]